MCLWVLNQSSLSVCVSALTIQFTEKLFVRVCLAREYFVDCVSGVCLVNMHIFAVVVVVVFCQTKKSFWSQHMQTVPSDCVDACSFFAGLRTWSSSQWCCSLLFYSRWNVWSKLRRQCYYKHSHSHFKCLFANNFSWCANWIELNWLSHYYNMISLVYLFIWYFHSCSPFPLSSPPAQPSMHAVHAQCKFFCFASKPTHIFRLFRWILSSYIQLHKCWMIKHLICMHNGLSTFWKWKFACWEQYYLLCVQKNCGGKWWLLFPATSILALSLAVINFSLNLLLRALAQKHIVLNLFNG